tara:strand:+ start:88 stop:276 length:189 start_codon:yes stop_codon:yes gene_type:complete
MWRKMLLSRNFVDPFAPFLGEYKVYIKPNEVLCSQKRQNLSSFLALRPFGREYSKGLSGEMK